MDLATAMHQAMILEAEVSKKNVWHSMKIRCWNWKISWFWNWCHISKPTLITLRRVTFSTRRSVSELFRFKSYWKLIQTATQNLKELFSHPKLTFSPLVVNFFTSLKVFMFLTSRYLLFFSSGSPPDKGYTSDSELYGEKLKYQETPNKD